MAEVMIAVACAAAHFRRFVVQKRHHEVVHHALALHAEIVNVITEAGTHSVSLSYACTDCGVCGSGTGGAPESGAGNDACGGGSGTNHRASSKPTYLADAQPAVPRFRQRLQQIAHVQGVLRVAQQRPRGVFILRLDLGGGLVSPSV